jgi:hypothetical protein
MGAPGQCMLVARSFNKVQLTLVEKRLLVAHHFGLCVAHMGCATTATPLVRIYQWRISKCATHNLPMRGAYCYMRH